MKIEKDGKLKHQYSFDDVTVKPERFLLNDVNWPWESHPHGMKAYLWHDGQGYNGAVVWASHDQDAIDELVDSDLLDIYLVDDKDVSDEAEERGEYLRAGNASEPFAIQESKLVPIDWKNAPPELIAAVAYGAGAGNGTLDD